MSEPQAKRPAECGDLQEGEADAGAAGHDDAYATSSADDERETLVHGEGESRTGPITVSVAGRTDVGLVREHNEDNYVVVDLSTGEREPSAFASVSSSGLLLGVCDGMGGAAAGEVASQMAVDTISELMRQGVPAADRDALARALVRAIEEAGRRIFEEARADRSRRGMGTTSTIATLMDRTLFVGQVGDSRAYILRSGEIKQLTKDQSLVNQLIEAGQLTEDEAEAFEHSNIILQALGTTEHVSVDLTFMELRRGDRLLMCSDGLSGLVHGDVIRDVLVEYDDLNACCDRLIELAKAAGGHDNVTVILAEFGGEGLALPQAGDLIGYQQYPLPLDNEQSDSDRSSRQSFPPTSRSSFPPSAVTSPEHGVRQGDGPVHGARRYAVFAVMGAVVLGAIYLLLSARRPPPEEELVGIEAVPVAPPMPPADVEIVVRSDADASELLVDGESQGPAVAGRWVLGLSPGPHKLEARAAGVSITSTVVEVRDGHPSTVFLSIPEGEDVGPASDAAAEDAPRERREKRRKRLLQDAAAGLPRRSPDVASSAPGPKQPAAVKNELSAPAPDALPTPILDEPL